MIIQNYNSLEKIFCLLMVSTLFISFEVSAQQLQPQHSPEPIEYSNEELVVYAKAAKVVMPLQQESQMRKMQVIEEHHLTIDKYNSMLDSRKTGRDFDATLTLKEKIAFNHVLEKIEEIQLEYEGVITEALKDKGISVKKYNEINNNYQHNPQLRIRIKMIMDELENPKLINS